MNDKKTYIQKFIENKKVPNETFSIMKPNGEEVSINLEETVQRIYAEGQGQQVRKILKKGRFRNATIIQCLKLFEGAAQRFLLDDMNEEYSILVQEILEKAHRRKESTFIEVQESEDYKQIYEILFTDKDEIEKPYRLKNYNTKEIVQNFNKRAFIEFLLNKHDVVKQVI
ncbi:hypothetical protein [Virgibacillus halodenitrificans]|uniref:hypothetical protein n=1 Tax=Virgibacillus halodenitrificans TaxID=1482 RepID=UPI000EF47F97|nr:hypothetical protein [Virgibacillus halodenitrificans]